MRRNETRSGGTTEVETKILEAFGDMWIRDLRRSYGPEFAFGKSDYVHLEDVLPDLDERSRSRLIEDVATRH